jgi:hypothetical protein
MLIPHGRRLLSGFTHLRTTEARTIRCYCRVLSLQLLGEGAWSCPGLKALPTFLVARPSEKPLCPALIMNGIPYSFAITVGIRQCCCQTATVRKSFSSEDKWLLRAMQAD